MLLGEIFFVVIRIQDLLFASVGLQMVIVTLSVDKQIVIEENKGNKAYFTFKCGEEIKSKVILKTVKVLQTESR